MTPEQAILAGRAAAEALMIDTCTITRVTSETPDLQTGLITTETMVVYTGPCRIQQKGHLSRPTTVAEAYLYQSPVELQLPMAVTAVRIRDDVTIDTSVLDPALAGQHYWVKEPAAKTHATSRRFGIESVAG